MSLSLHAKIRTWVQSRFWRDHISEHGRLQKWYATECEVFGFAVSHGLFLIEIEKPLFVFCLFVCILCHALNLFHHQTLVAPMQRSVCKPQEGAKGGGSRKIFWEFASEVVIRNFGELQCVQIEQEWKCRTYKMEKASTEPWTENENSPGAMQLREYTFREFWKIFGDDRFFRSRCVVQSC